MSMHEFIEHSANDIVNDWVEFAAKLHPAARPTNRDDLVDSANELLRAIVRDMATPETPEQQRKKARGERPDIAPEVSRVARDHAADRLSQGFTLNQLVAEYRALRADVTARWRAQHEHFGEHELNELTRFDEAVDQALTESVGWYFERLEDARDLLNAVLAHDLRNPLGSILVSLEFLLMSDLDGPYVKAASNIRTSARRMERMINEILDFTRTRLGSGLPVAPVECDLLPVCRAIVQELGAFHPDAKIQLATTGDLTGEWDRGRMEQLVSNLVSNAIEHGRHGGPVAISAQGHDREIELRVHNEGTPITASQLASIFDPLQSTVFRDRTRTATSQAGLGLGLYICRAIAHGHGGDIDVSSDASGTTFTVRLPRHPPRGADPAAAG